MRLVRQYHEYGCIIACVAMLADITYKQAYNIIFPYRKPKKLRGVFIDDRFFNRLNKIGLKIRKVKTASSYKQNALVGTDHPIYGFPDGFHGIVWSKVAGKFLDPYPSPHRKMHRQLTAKAYAQASVFAFLIYK